MIFYNKISGSNFHSFQDIKIDNEIEIVKKGNVIIVEIHLTAKDYIFYRKGQNYIEISNDLKLIYKEKDKLDERGVFNFLQFSTIIPPVSLFTDISVFLPGFRYLVNMPLLKIEQESLWSWSDTDNSNHFLSYEQQKQILKVKLEELIKKYTAEKQPLLLFSGGLDSNVLAQRISKMNFSNPVLVHYSFDLNHKYTLRAMSIAKKFKLPIKIVKKGEFNEYELLHNIGDYFKSPVSDPSTIMIGGLFSFISREFDPEKYVVLTGDGADSVIFKLDKIERLKYLDYAPGFLKCGLGSLYGMGKMYLQPSAQEKIIKFFKRSCHFGFYATILAQNPLLNIAYFLDSKEVRKSEEDINNMLFSTYKGDSSNAHNTLLTLYRAIKFTTYGINSIFNSNNFSVAAVYQDIGFVDFAIQQMGYWPSEKEDKFIFKEMLKEDLPSSLSHIEKTYFSLPFFDYYIDKRFLRLFEDVIETEHQFRAMINLRILKELYVSCKKQKKLPVQSYVFIWSLVVLHQWLKNISKLSDRRNVEP